MYHNLIIVSSKEMYQAKKRGIDLFKNYVQVLNL